MYRRISQNDFRYVRFASYGESEQFQKTWACKREYKMRKGATRYSRAMARVSFRIKRAGRMHHPRRYILLRRIGHKAPRQPRSTNHNTCISRRVRAAVISPSCLWGDELVFGDCLCAPRNTRESNIIGTCSIVRLSSPSLSSPAVIIPNGIAPFESLVVIITKLLSAFRIKSTA